MRYGFFNHPLWVRCHDRPIWVISLSESEHRLRDARAREVLRDFLPPHCEFATVTLQSSASMWPRIPANAAIVLLGRPKLLGPMAEQLLAKAQPPLRFHFLSNDPSSLHKYRSIVERSPHEVIQENIGVTDGDIFEVTQGNTFEEQRELGAKELHDLGIIYCGRVDDHPIFLFAGSSTVGTWGAVSYACENVIDEADPRWQQDVQGVVRCQVLNTREAFERVSATVNGPMLAPARFWMCGRDLPPLEEWRNSLRLCTKVPKSAYDLRILCNGNEIQKNSRTPLAALVLLAWASRAPRQTDEFDFFVASTTVGDVVQCLKDIDGFKPRHEQAIRAALKGLVQQIRKSGGIAYKERLAIHEGNQEPHTRFWLCARYLPSFLPSRI